MYNGKIIEDYASFGTSRLALMEAMGWKSHTQLRQFVEGNPTAENLEKVADYLGITIDSLFIRERPLMNDSRTDVDYIVVGSTFTPYGVDYKDLDSLHELLFERGIYSSPWHYVVPIEGASYCGDIGVDLSLLDINITTCPSMVRNGDLSYRIYRVAYVGGKDEQGHPADTRTEGQNKALEAVVRILRSLCPRSKIVTDSEFQQLLMGESVSEEILPATIL